MMHLLVWLVAVALIGVGALNAWLIGQAIIAARSAPPCRSVAFFPVAKRSVNGAPIPPRRRPEYFVGRSTKPGDAHDRSRTRRAYVVGECPRA